MNQLNGARPTQYEQQTQQRRSYTAPKTPRDPIMGVQRFGHLPFMSAGIFMICFTSGYSGLKMPKIHLEKTVFMTLAGNGLSIECELTMPANQSGAQLTCSDPFHKQIYNYNVPATSDQPENLKKTLKLENLTRSGEYSCQYKTAKVYWFLQVRDEGYKKIATFFDQDFIIVAVFTGALLVFNVVGSVYVFRGDWFDCSRKQKQNKELKKEKELKEDSVEEITTVSTSFYASLEHRPTSVYDVLDRSAANTGPDQHKDKPEKKKPQNKAMQTKQPQHDDILECVYENF